jgi:arginine metabolism regulation protein II
VLCWSKPVQFDKYGNQVRPVSDGYPRAAGAGDDDDVEFEPGSKAGFQRRNIDFVKYDKEYETYEEMDRDLGLLHSPNYSLIENNQTWIQGQFGVFEGLRSIPDHLMRKRRKLAKSKYATEARAIAASTNPQSRKSETPTISSRSGSTQVVPDTSSTAQINGSWQTGNIFDHQTRFNQEWLSDELRFDALLSATAATSTDQQSVFFDFLYPYTNNHPGAPVENASTTGNNEQPLDGSIAGDPMHSLDLFPYDRDVFNALRPHNVHNETILGNIAGDQHTAQDEPNNSHTNKSPTSSNAVNVKFNARDQIIISTNESKMPENVMKVINTPIFPSLSSNLKIPTTGLQVSSLTRFLLNHYYVNVADMMTVIPFQQNPWKTIYFPRAVKALGDLCAFGKSSDSRLSLLNALLAVSCFSLQSKFPKGSTEMKFFLNLGIEFRLQASSFLKKLLSNGDLSTQFKNKTEKYKDVLVANLSMNTIDVVWGTMADCHYYLSICEEIISKRMKERPSLSNKAKVLHRVFSFLKLMQDSTSFSTLSSINSDMKSKFFNRLLESQNNGETTEFYENVDQDGVIEIGFVNKGSFSEEYSPDFIDEDTWKVKTIKDVLLTDALYGLPNSLILLFSETVKLIELKFYFDKVEKTKEIESDMVIFSKLVESFENKLLSWKSEWKLTKLRKDDFISDLHEAIHHHSVGFYKSVIIYFFTMIKNMKIEFLQTYSIDCITHLEQLHNMVVTKADVNVLPLMWQGFIGGCVAKDLDLQNRYRKWASDLASDGVGSYWGARQMMFEVWRRRKNMEINDNWISVHQDWQMNIMLC